VAFPDALVSLSGIPACNNKLMKGGKYFTLPSFGFMLLHVALYCFVLLHIALFGFISLRICRTMQLVKTNPVFFVYKHNYIIIPLIVN
jgi:hypothetical protein